MLQKGGVGGKDGLITDLITGTDFVINKPHKYILSGYSVRELLEPGRMLQLY